MAGSKPVALHTEYAKESADQDKPYGGGNDIVFYLQRADQGGAEDGGLPTSEDEMFKSMAGGGYDGIFEPTPGDELLFDTGGGTISGSDGGDFDLDSNPFS